MSLLEILATFFGLLTVFFVARGHICNFFFGMIMVSLYAIIFFDVKLYADMGLQLIFFCFQFYGLYHWLYGGTQHTALSVRTANAFIYSIATCATLLLTTAIAFILHQYTDSTTFYIDAFTTSLSLVAQWMMSKKWIEHWLLWITVDVVSIWMYIHKNLYLTSGLYAVFLMICVFGYYAWRKEMGEKRLAPVPAC